MTAEYRLSSQYHIMLYSIFAAYVLACAGAALAKPEQIRAVQDPIFHFYLQSYPKNGKFMTSACTWEGLPRKMRKGQACPGMECHADLV